ncbi:ABC-2 family transporter protein [Bacillus cereus]|nr:ABC-2 family transporter protein [Bacillus cereus]
MLDMVYIELMKMKRTKLLYLIILSNTVPLIFSCMYLLADSSEVSVINTTMYIKTFLGLLLAPLLFSMVASRIFIREYKEKNTILYNSYPHSLKKFYFSKCITIFVIIASNLSFILGGNFLLCLMLSERSFRLESILHEFFSGIELVVCQLALAMFSVMFTLFFRSYLAGFIITVIGCATTLIYLVSNFKTIKYFNPYYISLAKVGLSKGREDSFVGDMGGVFILMILSIMVSYWLFEQLEEV